MREDLAAWKTYNVIRHHEEGRFLVIHVDFQSAVYGEKVLVFKNASLVDLMNQKEINPRIGESDDSFIRPIADFFANEEGWLLAVGLVSNLSGEEDV